MARFESRNVSEADVPAPRARIWSAVSSPACLAQLTPLIRSITADGDLWQWKLKTISALGTRVDPSFTEKMSFEDQRLITFEHAGEGERAGARGTYTLSDTPDGGTHLAVDITIHVELPLPALSRRAVERVMGSMMARTGERFASNLYDYLGVDGTGRTAPAQATT